MEVKSKKIGFIFTDCLCNFKKLLQQMKTLKKLGADIFPIVDNFLIDFEKDIEEICENKIIHYIEDSKYFSSNNLFDIVIIAPASENTISRLACDIIDTYALEVVKLHLRNNLPVVVAPSCIDGLRSKFN